MAPGSARSPDPGLGYRDLLKPEQGGGVSGRPEQEQEQEDEEEQPLCLKRCWSLLCSTGLSASQSLHFLLFLNMLITLGGALRLLGVGSDGIACTGLSSGRPRDFLSRVSGSLVSLSALAC